MDLAAHTAVWSFFAHSGYLMGKGFHLGKYTLNRKGITSYVNNRAIRILPMMWIFFTPSIFLALYETRGLYFPDWIRLGRALIFWMSPHDASEPNPPLWSLVVEWQFYMVTPAIYFAFLWLYKKGANGLFLIGMVLVAGIVNRTIAFGDGMDYGQWMHKMYLTFAYSLDMFVAGILLNFVKPLEARSLPRILLGWAAIVGAIAFSTIALKSQNEVLTRCFYLGFQALVAAATLFLIHASDIETGSSQSRSFTDCIRNPLKALEWGGVLAFMIYVLATPTYNWLSRRHVLGPTQSVGDWAKQLFILTFATILVSIVAYVLIERPLRYFRSEERRGSAPPKVLPLAANS